VGSSPLHQNVGAFRVSHDDRDCLVVMLDLRATQQERGGENAFAELAGNTATT